MKTHRLDIRGFTVEGKRHSPENSGLTVSSNSYQEFSIKGPLLQHHLRNLRVWNCPKCGRIVRTRGNVTSRSCPCADPAPMMKLEATPRYREFDLTEFITYTTEEFTTPTEAELVEELPEYELPPAMKAIAEGKPLEKPLRRGKGYLRAEIDAEDTGDSESEVDTDFGAGIDDQPGNSDSTTTDEEFSDDSSVDVASTENETSIESTPVESDADADSKPKKRRRGRRRRGRRRSGENRDGDSAGTADGTAAESNGSSEVSANSDGESGKSKKPRRRRRRGRRNRSGGGDASSGDTNSGGSPGEN